MAFGRPTALGSHWISKKGIFHGPRVMKPEEFKSFFIKDPEWAKKNNKRIQNYKVIKGKRLPKDTKLKIGTLKGTKKLAIQSFMGKKLPKIKIKSHLRRSKKRITRVKLHYRRRH